MKKYVLLAALNVLSFNTHAGWYGALNLGINNVNIEKNLVYPLGDNLVTSSNFRNAYTNFHGQLAAGYDFFLSDRLGLGIEGNADLFTGRSKYTIDNWFFDDSVLAKERFRYGFSLFALPEYQFNETTRFFIGPGVSESQFVINSNNTAGNVGVTGHFDKWLTGWGGKVGAASRLSPTTELLFTYQFTQYRNVSWTNIEPLSGELLRGNYKPQVNLFMIGLRMTMPTAYPMNEK